MTVRQQLAHAFHDTQSFKWDREKGFKLASGEISPFYVDCRALMAHPEARRLVAQLAYEELTDIEFECLGLSRDLLDCARRAPGLLRRDHESETDH